MIDAVLKVDTPSGPVWHRYNADGYGEHEDGSPFDGTGVGQAWPLLTGERAHYELAAGNYAAARQLLKTMERFANEGGLIPEQVWTLPDVPKAELFTGRASGSAMPLVWAHAEYLKLVRSLADKHVFDMPGHTVQRYLAKKIKSPHTLWRFNQKCRFLTRGTNLRIELLEPAVVDWKAGEKQEESPVSLAPTGLGTCLADLPTAKLPEGTVINFSFSQIETKQWEGVTFQVLVN